MPQNKKSEQGNVFVIILIAVALFGALIFTFTRSGSQGTSTVSKQEAKIAAQEILNYARLVEGAVDRVRRNGCSETEISFESAVAPGYSNPNSPIDKSCHIFEPEGGKIQFIPVNPSYLATPTSNPYFDFRGVFQIIGVGTSKTDLIMQKGSLDQNVCSSINELLNINVSPNPPIDNNTGSGVMFTGFYGGGLPDTLNDENTALEGQATACRLKDTIDRYKFYHVLLAR
jgi:hypothetical protein